MGRRPGSSRVLVPSPAGRERGALPGTAARELRQRRADVERVIPRRRRSVVILLAAGIVVHAAGEAVGLLRGDGGATIRRADVELNRRAHLIAGERGRP